MRTREIIGGCMQPRHCLAVAMREWFSLLGCGDWLANRIREERHMTRSFRSLHLKGIRAISLRNWRRNRYAFADEMEQHIYFEEDIVQRAPAGADGAWSL